MARGVAKVRIPLYFQQRFRKSAVGLVHPYEFRPFGKGSFADFESSTFFWEVVTYTSTPKNSDELLRVLRWLNQKAKQLARSTWPHRFFSDRIKVLQPLNPILSRVPHQQKCRGRHVVRDVAQPPFTATPQWSKVRRLLLRIVTLTRRKFAELQRHRRCDLRGSSFRQHAHTRVVVRIADDVEVQRTFVA